MDRSYPARRRDHNGVSRELNGAASIGAIAGAQATNEEAFALKRLITASIGSDRISAG